MTLPVYREGLPSGVADPGVFLTCGTDFTYRAILVRTDTAAEHTYHHLPGGPSRVAC